MFWIILWLLGLIGTIVTKAVGLLNWLTFLVGLFVLVALFLLLIWYVLAPSNRFFTFIKEGSAKIVVKGDAFQKGLIQWKGFTLDDEQNVVPEDKWIKKGEVVDEGTPGAKIYKRSTHLFGGLRLYGFWPIWDIIIYRLRWNDIHRSEEKGGRIEEVKFHEELLDYVLLKPDVYWTKIPKAETKPPERIPTDIEFLITMKVVNVYKVLFAAPINWVENVMTRLDAVLRGFIGGKTLDELIDLKGKASEVWKELKENEFVKNLKTEWGVEILENGIEVKEIGMTDEYQKALSAQRTEEMKAAGEQKRIEGIYGAIQKFGDLGKLIRTLEAAEKSPLAASLTVQAIPGLQEVLRGIFGKTPEEKITPDELRRLRQILEAETKKQEK